MAETLLNQALAPDFAPEPFIQWLTSPELQGAQTSTYACSRTDFITYFLNYVHEEIGGAISDRKPEPQDNSKSSTELSPLDLTTSTPKGASDSSVLSYMSPISPICLGDFLVNKRGPPRKTKKRIKPTNLTLNSSSFHNHKSENSFNFSNESEEFPSGRSLLLEERLKVDFRSPKTVIQGGEVPPDPALVTNRPQIERLVQFYSLLIADNCVLNLTREIYFLISLLLKKQFYNNDWGINVLSDKITNFLFNSIHNVVYFASKSLENLVGVLQNFDNSTVRLLTENSRLREFAPTLTKQLEQIVKPDRVVSIETLQNNICFNSDTDNRNNFPNDLSFHAFKKQRDLFYDILRIWEQHHLAPGFNYVVSLGGKIKTLLNLSHEPTNFLHFARLFKAQLLTCRTCDDLIITSLDVDAQKLNKLKNRCVTKESNQGLNSLPKFSESEEFYRDFIVVGANFSLNRHLADAFIEEIVELNESYFANAEEDENSVDLVTKKSYFSCVKSLRILAKFLGFVESLPYKSDYVSYSEQLLTTHLKIRKQICPTFDVKTLLENSIRRKSVILCVPWLIKYLSMLDTVTLKLPYYTQIQSTLYWIYRNFNWGPSPNIYLIKFCLGWLFELPHIPDNNALYFTNETTQNSTKPPKTSYIDQLEIVDQDILYFCCPYLNEIKKLLTTTTTNQMITIKHITPVTAQQSPDEIARKKLEQQLEEAFFNGQPISLRKSVEFVSERVASTCVKYVCSVLVPEFKKKSLETFKSMISTIDDDSVLKIKANQFATDCLNELQVACDREIKKITQTKVQNAIESLLAIDVLPQTRHVCVGITEKMCLERVRQWLEAHVTTVIFSKDFNDEVQKLTNETKRTKPLFVLPPGGSKLQHNDNTISGALLITKFQSLTSDIIEDKQNVTKQLIILLDATTGSINERGDLNQCVVATLCTQILDIVILLLGRGGVLADGVLSKSCDIWRLYYRDDLFKSLLSPRNVTILGHSKATWDAFAQFCAKLLKLKLLTCDSFESQCTGIFRTDWDQGTLKVISDFFKRFHTLYRGQGGGASDFTFLLDFFSDYCEDLA